MVQSEIAKMMVLLLSLIGGAVMVSLIHRIKSEVVWVRVRSKVELRIPEEQVRVGAGLRRTSAQATLFFDNQGSCSF